MSNASQTSKETKVNPTKAMLSEQELINKQQRRVEKSLTRLQSALASAGLDWTQPTPETAEENESLAFEQYLATFR